MSELSEENVIKDTVNQFVEYAEEILDSYDYERPVDVTINKEDIECIKGLLDLYQKEKEKNEENTAMIDLMAQAIENLDDQLVINHYKNKEEVIERFRGLLEERN